MKLRQSISLNAKNWTTLNLKTSNPCKKGQMFEQRESGEILSGLPMRMGFHS